MVGLRRGLMLPGGHENDRSGLEHGIEDIPRDEARRVWVQTQPFGDVPSGRLRNRLLRVLCRSQDDGGSADLGLVESLLAQFVPRRQVGVVRDLANPQVLVTEDLGPALGLNVVMACFRAPAHEGFLVVPYR